LVILNNKNERGNKMPHLDDRFLEEVRKRRTFAIISHPDAGKTTLTEKLLLYGGAIRLAGTVKARKAQKYATSDWMEIEKQRGISVTSSVLQFDYNDFCINILDTPGHQDFSEDTYRTLVAADSAVMVIDAAKGVEEQTKKLFHVCKMRGIPIFTFVNKLDRAGKDPFELMEELEKVLGIRAYPINWPIGTDGNFKGVYNRKTMQIEVFDGGNHGQTQVISTTGNVDDEIFKDLLGEHLHKKLCSDIELLDMAGDEFDLKRVRRGELTPMFFGSALTNFGVEPFLKDFLEMTTMPTPRVSDIGEIYPDNDSFSAFIFKIQANMNPAHRDRIAFMRICSGKFEKGMESYHIQAGKNIKLAQPQQFLAQERAIVEEAYPGDIIGIFDPGIFNLGDTLCEKPPYFKYQGIPVFPPEHFARVSTIDSMKRKQFIKGVSQLSEEGAIQVFKQIDIGREELIIGVVGMLQFEVLEYRLKHEYGVDIRVQNLPYRFIRWVEQKDIDPSSIHMSGDTMAVRDKNEDYVILFVYEWSIQRMLEGNKGLKLLEMKNDFSY
jgi:peptide chain release factor 3